jgi:hypothetical protein
MAFNQKAPHAGQGPLFLPRLRHHLQGAHGHRAPGRRGRDPDRPERLGNLAAAHVPPGPRTQFELCGVPGRHGPRLRTRRGAGHRRGFGLPVRNRLQARGLLRPHGRARHADGRHPRHLRRPVRHAARQRPHPLGGLQRNGRGADPVAHAAGLGERHGLDVRQLFDHGPARRAGLVEEVPRSPSSKSCTGRWPPATRPSVRST